MARAPGRHVMTPSSPQVSRGMLVNLGIGLVVLFAAASVVISSYVAEAQRRSGGPHRYKLDVQVLGSNWGTAQATEPFQGPFATEAGQTDSIEERRVGKLRQADEPQIEMDQDESEDGVEDLPTLEEGKVLTEIHNYPVVNSTAPKRVALLFFGLQRSLSLTLLSIQRRVINKLTDVGYEVTVFVHQFEDLGKEDKHSKGVRWKWWTMLRPFDHSLTSQATFLKNHRSQLDACANHGTGWVYDNEPKQRVNVDNMSCQLKSVEEVGKLWEAHYLKHPEEYAGVVFMRPDVQYQCDFPVHVIPDLKEGEVHVPNWGDHMGMNDRFAILHPKSALLWKGRLQHTLSHCLEAPIHSETFVKHFSITNHLQVIKLPADYVFFRVRSDGSIPEPDYLLPGYDFAKDEIKDRQAELKSGHTAVPDGSIPKPHTWKMSKGSRAGKSRQRYIDSTKKDREEAEKERAKQEEESTPPSPPPPPKNRKMSPEAEMSPKGQKVSKPQDDSEAKSQKEEQSQQSKKENKSPKPQKDVDPQSEEWDNSVAVCAIMKQEKLSDIREWLLYHQWLGVDKIYLRENKNNTEQVSQHIMDAFGYLVEAGFLDLGTWPGQSPEAQQLWYNRCAQGDLAGAQAWVLFSDLDEYPVLLDGGVAAEEPDLKAFMRRHRGAAGLTLQWVMFGSSGIRERPTPGGPLRHFHKCSDQLSFEMKCFAASHHLSETPFIHPYFIHGCCYKHETDTDPKDGPSILYGDGKQKRNIKLKRFYEHSDSPDADIFNMVQKKKGPKCRFYEGHLRPNEYTDEMKAIPQSEALVLFHYMTRSFQDFRERKLARYAGMYVDDFRERRANATREHGKTPPDEELFDDLEHDLGIDLDAAVCSSAADANYASKCCE